MANSQISVDADGDKFGKIYEYFLGNFARAEGQRGGEFFTPTTMVQLIVEVVQPFHGRLEELNEELTVLNSEASEREERIANNVAKLLEEAV